LNPLLTKIRWRLFWTSLISLALAVGCFSLSQWVYAPSDDLCLWSVESVPRVGGEEPRVFIRSVVTGGPSGLAEGDELLAVHDIKIPDYNDRLSEQENLAQIVRALKKIIDFINSCPGGTAVQYTVVRGGETLALPVELEKAFDASNAILLATGLVAWAIGILVVLSSPQRKIARHFYYLGALTLLMAAGASTSGTYIYTLPAGVAALTACCQLLFHGLMPPVWFHFFMRFPYGFEVRKYRHLLAAVYALSLLALVLEVPVALDLMVKASGSAWALNLLVFSLPTDLLGRLVSFGRGFQVALGGAGVALFLVGSFKIPASRRKALMVPLLFTFAVFFNMLAYLWLTKSYSRTHDWGFFTRSSYYFFLPLPFLPITFAIAILRHGFFNVRRAVVRWLSYFMAFGALIVAYLAALAWLFTAAMPKKMPMSWMGVVMGLLALPLAGAFRWLLSALRKRFKRDVNTARDLIMGNIRGAQRRFSEEALLENLTESLQEAYRPQVHYCLPVVAGKVALPQASAKAGDCTIQPGGPGRQELRLPSAMLRHAKEGNELVYGLGGDEAEWVLSQSRALRNHIDCLGAQIMVLLMAGDRPHSVLLLGGKYSELNYSREDRELLHEAALAVGAQLESAAMHMRLLDKTRMDQELQAARNIQESLTTSAPPDAPGFRMASRLVPAAETGGDLLWVAQRGPDQWIAVVGDVSGKGLPAAIYMSQSMALLNFAAREADASLETILAGMDHALRNLMSPKDFLTLCIIEWRGDGRFKIVRAGHPPPLHLGARSRGAPTLVAPQGLALGMRPAYAQRWHVFEGALDPGDWVAMYSDGLTEAMDNGGNLYGIDRLAAQLGRFWGTGSPGAACEAIFQQVAAFEAQNRDDRTLFILARSMHGQ